MKIKLHGLLDAFKQASTYAIIAALLTLSTESE